ncbi:MAG TPA: hypothetical protein V6C85_02655 [Allocoleopsis sp.]
MVAVKEALSAQALACLEKLRALDLSAIAAKLMHPENGYGWTERQALKAIDCYKAFLFVSYLYPEVLLVPTQEIDRVWHCHILHTRKYRQDCQMLFGYFIDHEPESGVWDRGSSVDLDAAFAQTQALLAVFEQYFNSGRSLADRCSPNIVETNHRGTEFAEQRTRGNREIKEVWEEGLHLTRSACGRPLA